MADLRSTLERRAERGEARGATEVLRAAQATCVDVSLPVRHRRPVVLVLTAIGVLVAIVATVTMVVASQDDPSHVSTSAPRSTADVIGVAPPTDGVLWTDTAGLVHGDPATGGQTRVPVPCQSCSIVRVGGVLFVTSPRLLRVEAADTSDLGPAQGAFPAADEQHLYVVVAMIQTSATAVHTVLQEVDLAGVVVGGPWTVPDGYTLTHPAPRAVDGGVLIQTSENAADHTLAVWNPPSGEVSPIGPARQVIDVLHRDDGHELVAYTKAGCAMTGCSIAITDLTSGHTTDIASPTGNGYYGGGAFSPDGSQLAAFAATNPGNVNPGAELTIVDVATRTATQIARSHVAIGESYGFAFWSPNGSWLYFGGLSPQLKAHHRGTNDSVELSLPANYNAIADSR